MSLTLSSSSSADKEGQAQTKNKVSFDKSITIQEYPIILGDNPSCVGAPITIGWNVLRTTQRNFELFEYTHLIERSQREQQQRPRTKNSSTPNNTNNSAAGGCRRLSIPKRSQLLLEAGYTQEQIIQRVLEVEVIKKLRADSAKETKNSINQQLLVPVQGFGKFLSKNIKLLTIGSSGSGSGSGVNNKRPPLKTTSPVTARTA